MNCTDWKLYKFGDCAQLINGRAYSQAELLTKGLYRVIRIQNLNGGAKWYFSDLQLEEQKYCTEGDLLFAWSATFGPYVWRGEKSIFHYHLWNVKPFSNILDKDFAYFLLLWITENIKSGAHGIAMLHFAKEAMEEYEVKLPPFSAQGNIAARLNAQFGEVEIARRAAESQLKEAVLLPNRIINEAFDEIRGEEITLGEVLIDIQAGRSFQTAETLADSDELGVLKVSAVTWSDFRPNEAKSLLNTYEPDESHQVKRGDFLISRANTKEFVGAVVLVESDYPNRLLSDKTLRLIVDESRISKEFLLFALRSSGARNHIEHFATGTSDSMRNISQGTIRTIPLTLPELNEQRQIASQLKNRLKKVSEVRAAIDTQLREIEQLPNRILAQTFQN